MKEWQIWIDTGGTFTDCLAIDPQGNVHRNKVLSSSQLRGHIKKTTGASALISQGWGFDDDILKGFHFSLPALDFTSKVVSFDGQQLELKDDLPANYQGDFQLSSDEEAPLLATRVITKTPLGKKFPAIKMRLGTTRGTNALLEHKGEPPLLVITTGFTDQPLIGNQQRPDLFALNIQKPSPLHSKAFEIKERIDQEGVIQEELSDAQLEELSEYCRDQQVNNVAIALLNSYRNAQHEREIANCLKRAGVSYITQSAALSNQIKFQPRCETAIVNAYLLPVLHNYLKNISREMKQLKVMTSAGGLASVAAFQPKDSLLSGPAGGVVAASYLSRQTGEDKIITFDMGGTSTDVARYAGRFDYQYETTIGKAHISGPSLHIHTVAAGGGSVCGFDGKKFSVGPESGGADPGPASYGAGGPFCLSDVNLLLGRMASDRFSIPLSKDAAEEAFRALLSKARRHTKNKEAVLEGFLDIANEKMADAIRQISVSRGYDPEDYSLLAFGGAGGMHACRVATLLGMKKVLIPRDAGILSAYGIGHALDERFVSCDILKPLQQINDLPGRIKGLSEQARSELLEAGYQSTEIERRHVFCYLRLQGQEHSLEISWSEELDLAAKFEEEYRQLYGHYIEDRSIELASLKVVVSVKAPPTEAASVPGNPHKPDPLKHQPCWQQDDWQQLPVYDIDQLQPGAQITGPAIILYPTSTAFIEKGWQGVLDHQHTLIVDRQKAKLNTRQRPEEIELELFSNRFTGIAEEMGALLQRTAFSVNVKERLDFSCALLDRRGDLIVNAPHIPVHLGALGICVKEVCKTVKMAEGDVVITNSPAHGGSHLPDVTLVMPVYHEQELIGYAANRAHHAEIGGITPGSMPANARRLSEEGVLIKPCHLVAEGELQWSQIKALLNSAKYPSRAIHENLADLNAALASLQRGRRQLQRLAQRHGADKLQHFMAELKTYADYSLWQALPKLGKKEFKARETLDDGSRIQVTIKLAKTLTIDFNGSSKVHPGNMNANRAIVSSVVLYVLRLIAGKDIPLNEGLMKRVKILLPRNSMLNPVFPDDPTECPAVVGGNVELSQRLTDTLLKAFALAACSQGTMNNVLFGNDNFGYYETICGGSGAGEGFNGADAVHQHMTNTRITDPEIMEWRYPVRVKRFEIRNDSGGSGKWRGGNGVIRELEFLEPVTLNVLTQHRTNRPYGLMGGGPGQAGRQSVLRANGGEEELDFTDSSELKPGDCLVIETPGGGGYGADE